MCAAIGCFSQFVSFCCTTILAWISFYVFVFAFFQFQMKGAKYELCGILVTLFLSAMLSWEPFISQVYGLSGIWCFMATRNRSLYLVYALGLSHAPQVLLCVLSLVTVTCVAVFFCVHSRVRRSQLQKIHMRALKEVLPLLLYPTVYCFAYSVAIAQNVIVFLNYKRSERDSYIHETIVIALYQTLMIFLPISLLIHSHIRQSLKSCFSLKRNNNNNRPATSQLQTNRGTLNVVSKNAAPSASRTCYVVPPESLCTETDPLVIAGHNNF